MIYVVEKLQNDILPFRFAVDKTKNVVTNNHKKRSVL